MSARHCHNYRPQEALLPADAQAMSLEAQGLWRRAASRWQRVLLHATDDRVMEAILQRHQACLRNARHGRQSGGEVSPSAADGVATGRAWLPNGPELWRTA
ncbi:PerC family transcriptional regulator [Serratia ureilytica]|uniref:PerC family transcriptional regulator n=1 Tax=Serratia ureilytica TaxID=300181 RepID=UPI0034C633C5